MYSCCMVNYYSISAWKILPKNNLLARGKWNIRQPNSVYILYFWLTIVRFEFDGSIFGGKFSSLLFGDIHDSCSILNAIEKDIKLWMRACWLEALMFLQKKDTFAACSALSMVIRFLFSSLIIT